jgi:hypothetical protein
MDNYADIVSWVRRRPSSGGPVRILNYGCGQGIAVKMLRDQAFDCYGCDAFVQIGKAPRDHLLNPQWFGRTGRFRSLQNRLTSWWATR